MDYGRKQDLEELSKMRQGQLSPRARHEVEMTIEKIVHESVPVRDLREQLIKATRGGDTHEIRKIQSHIHAIRQQETNGREF